MGVLKNDVGRPSNKTIKIRFILKLIGLILIILLAFFVGYKLPNINHIDGKDKNTKVFDKSQITTRVANQDITPDIELYDIYVYGKKLDLDFVVESIYKVDVIDDVAVIELSSLHDVTLIIVDTEANILHEVYKDSNMYYCASSSYSPECYGYKVKDNKITYYAHDLGQSASHVCNTNYNNEVLIEYELTYDNGKLSNPKKLSSMFGKEYIEEHDNIVCE